MFIFHVCLVLIAFITLCGADTLANCSYAEIEGTWEFKVGSKNANSSVDCSKFGRQY